jgi:hypothetical protein
MAFTVAVVTSVCNKSTVILWEISPVLLYLHRPVREISCPVLLLLLLIIIPLLPPTRPPFLPIQRHPPLPLLHSDTIPLPLALLPWVLATNPVMSITIPYKALLLPLHLPQGPCMRIPNPCPSIRQPHCQRLCISLVPVALRRRHRGRAIGCLHHPIHRKVIPTPTATLVLLFNPHRIHLCHHLTLLLLPLQPTLLR